jgi:hypothetical protein
MFEKVFKLKELKREGHDQKSYSKMLTAWALRIIQKLTADKLFCWEPVLILNTVSNLRHPFVKSIAWYVNPINIFINFKLRHKNLRKFTNFAKIFSYNEMIVMFASNSNFSIYELMNQLIIKIFSKHQKCYIKIFFTNSAKICISIKFSKNYVYFMDWLFIWKFGSLNLFVRILCLKMRFWMQSIFWWLYSNLYLLLIHFISHCNVLFVNNSHTLVLIKFLKFNDPL